MQLLGPACSTGYLLKSMVPQIVDLSSKTEVGVSYLSPAAASTGFRAVLVQGPSFPKKPKKLHQYCGGDS